MTLPTDPGYYVTDLSVNPEDPTNPYGSTIFVLDDIGDEPVYPRGIEAAATKYGWTMLRLAVER